MKRPTPRSTRTATLLPYPTLFRSKLAAPPDKEQRHGEKRARDRLRRRAGARRGPGAALRGRRDCRRKRGAQPREARSADRRRGPVGSDCAWLRRHGPGRGGRDLRRRRRSPRSDRKSAVLGKSVSVRVDLGGRGNIQKKNRLKTITTRYHPLDTNNN